MDGLLLYLAQVIGIKLLDSGVIAALKVIPLFEIMLQYAADMVQEVILQVLQLYAITSNVIEYIRYLPVCELIHCIRSF
jgi:hypothetical protein